MRVLAVGATGQFAGLVVPALVSKGLQVRALVHDPAKADRVRELGADEAVAGDLRDRGSINAALDGVDAVFHVTPAFAPDSAALGIGMVEAATAAGVDRFVFSGVYQLAAGGMTTRTEIAALMSRHAGRTVIAEDVDPDVALADLPAGDMRDGLAAMFADYTAHGFHGGNSLVLRTILGRAPRTLDRFIAELAA